MKREELLKEVVATCCGNREQAHGNPQGTFERIARLWTTYLRNDGIDVSLSSADVSMMMALFKVARLQGNPSHVDSWVDAVGYLACGCEIQTEK